MLLGEVFWACVSGSRPQIRPRPETACVVPLERARINVRETGKSRHFSLDYCPTTWTQIRGRRWMDGNFVNFQFTQIAEETTQKHL